MTELTLCTDDGDENDESKIPPASIDDTFFDIAMLCPMIQQVSAWHVKASSNLNLVILKCAHLKTINLHYCTDITSNTIKSICSASNVSCLELHQSQFDSDTPDFSDYKGDSIRELSIWEVNLSRAGKINLCNCFPLLTILSAGPVCGDDLVVLASICPHIKNTHIYVEGMVTDEHAQLLCKQWRQVELLQLESEMENRAVCSEEAVLILLKGCPQLLKLSVCNLDSPHGKDHLYHSSTRRVAVDAHTIVSSGTLANTSVAIIGTGKAPAKSKVTDLFLESASEATLRVILTLCPQLNTLAIRHCTPIKPPRNVLADQQRAAEYALSSLNHSTCSVRKLHLHNIRSLAGVDLLSLTGLEELQLSNIGKKLGNEVLLQVVKNNPSLRSISLYNCELLRGYSLILSLLNLCPLHTFNFFECDALLKENRSTPFPTSLLVLEDMTKQAFPNIKKLNLRL